MQVFIAALIAFFLYLFYQWDKNEKKKKQEAEAELEAKRQLLSFITSYLPSITSAVIQGRLFFRDYKQGYLTNHELNNWKNSFSKIYEAVKDKNYENIG